MDYVTIYAYPKVWKIENKIYSFWNLHLPAPVELRMFLYFGVLCLLMWLLGRFLPFLHGIPWAIRYLVIPFAGGQFLMRKKLDGKMPQRYFVSLLQYIGQLGHCRIRFESCPVKQPAVKLDWYCGRKPRTRNA